MNLGQNKGSVIGGGILLLLMLACGFFMWKFRSANKALDAECNSLVEQIAAIGKGKDPRGNAKPSPTRENVRAIDDNIRELTGWYSNYVDRLFVKLPPQQIIDPADFQLKATKIADDIAALASEKNVELGLEANLPRGALGAFPGGNFQQPGAFGAAPEEPKEDEVIFNMDFDKFLSEGERPDEEDIPRLTRQLAIIDDIVRLLLDNEVDRIVSVERDKFDVLDPNDRAGGGGFPGFNPGFAPGEELVEDEVLFENEVFRFAFEGKEAAVFKSLDAMNQLPYPASVMQIKMMNLNPDLVPFQDAAAQVAGQPRVGSMPSPLDGAADAISLILATGDEGVQVEIEVYVAKPPEPIPDDL